MKPSERLLDLFYRQSTLEVQIGPDYTARILPYRGGSLIFVPSVAPLKAIKFGLVRNAVQEADQDADISVELDTCL